MKRIALMVVFAVLMSPLVGDAQEGPYRFVKEIAIGGEGGWDYLSIDPAAHRLFVSHGTRIVVVDTRQNKVAGEITDTPGVHGLTVAADLGRGFTANGGENTVSIIDLATLKTLQKVQTGKDPDTIAYDPVHHEGTPSARATVRRPLSTREAAPSSRHSRLAARRRPLWSMRSAERCT
jgi:YVTN family beta-propeller protein